MPYSDPEAKKAHQKRYRAEVRAEGGERYQTQMKACDAWNKRVKAEGGDALVRVKGFRAQWQRDYRLRSPRETLINQAKGRAKKFGLPCDITVEGLEWPTHCPILGLELDYNKTVPGERRTRVSVATLDRKTNNLGYVLGNVFVISHRANRIKSDATVEEMRAVVAYMDAAKTP